MRYRSQIIAAAFLVLLVQPLGAETKMNHCMQLIQGPEYLLDSSEVLFVGRPLEDHDFLAGSETVSFVVDAVWRGDLAHEELICIRMLRNGCKQTLRAGQEYLVWSSCTVKEVNDGTVKDSLDCRAYSIAKKRGAYLYKYMMSDAPLVTPDDLLDWLHPWAEGTATTKEIAAWLDSVGGFRGVGHSPQVGNPLVIESLSALDGWLHDPLYGPDQIALCLDRHRVRQIADLLANNVATAQERVAEWKKVENEVSGCLRRPN